MMRRLGVCTIFLAASSTALLAFEEKPWLGEFLEFYFDPSYTYTRFRDVQNAVKQPSHASNNQVLAVDLGLCPLDGWDAAAEFELAHTPRQTWGRRSVGIQVRKRFLDDVMGDRVSLTAGGTVRQVAGRSVRDISSPYAAPWNFEAHTAVGQEWSQGASWYMRWFGVGALGMGNRGSPWLRARGVFEMNRENRHQGIFFATGYWGFGHRKKVDVDAFTGWGKINHSSVDLGVGYRYVTDVWGYFFLEYAYRVFARSYPERQNSIQVGYHLPFSPFTNN